MKVIKAKETLFFLDIRGGKLLCGQRRIHLTNRLWALFCHFVKNEGKLLSKDDLLNTVWHGTAVTNAAVDQAISELRKALGDDSKTPFIIVTEYGRGYRFDAEIKDQADTSSSPINSLENDIQSIKDLIADLFRSSPDPHDAKYIAPMLLKAQSFGRNLKLSPAYFRALDVLIADIDQVRTGVTYPAPAHLSVKDLDTVISTLEDWLNTQNT